MIKVFSSTIYWSRDTVVSRAKFTRSARWTVYIYARPKVEPRLSDLKDVRYASVIDW